MEYLFVDKSIKTGTEINLVLADNIKKAKIYYAKYYWANSKSMKNYIENKSSVQTFWGYYFYDNSKMNFTDNILEDLNDFYFNDSRTNYNNLLSETKQAIAIWFINKEVEKENIKIIHLGDINRITKDYTP